MDFRWNGDQLRDYVKPKRHVNIEHSIMQIQMQTINTNIIYFHFNYIPVYLFFAKHFGHFTRNSNQMEFQDVGKDHLLFSLSVSVCLTWST